MSAVSTPVRSAETFAVRLAIPGSEVRYLSPSGGGWETWAALHATCLYPDRKAADLFVERVRKANPLLPAACVVLFKVGFVEVSS